MTKVLITLVFALSVSLRATETIPNYPLVNQEGKPFQLYDLKGKHLLISFIFTRCPLEKMCPLTVSLNKRLLSEYQKLKKPHPLQFLFITLDPEFDTAPVLSKFAKNRNLPRKFFTLATGNAQVLSDLASQFNVIGFPSGNSNLITHNLKTILLDPELKTVKEFKDNEWAPKEVLPFLH